MDDFRDSAQGGARQRQDSQCSQITAGKPKAGVPTGAEGVSGNGQDRTVKAVERSDSAVVVTTLTWTPQVLHIGVKRIPMDWVQVM